VQVQLDGLDVARRKHEEQQFNVGNLKRRLEIMEQNDVDSGQGSEERKRVLEEEVASLQAKSKESDQEAKKVTAQIKELEREMADLKKGGTSKAEKEKFFETKIAKLAKEVKEAETQLKRVN